MHVYENDSKQELYSIEYLSRNGLPIPHSQNIAKFNKLLFEDFLNNHYPWFKKNWEEVSQLNTNIKDLHKQIKQRISDLSISELEAKNIPFMEGKGSDNHVIYLRVFVSCLMDMVIESRYNDNKIHYSEDYDAIILDDNKLIYQCSKADNPNDLICKLQFVCNSIKSDAELRDIVINYNRLLNESEVEQNKLFQNLNKILICQSLKSEKRHFFWDKCNT